MADRTIQIIIDLNDKTGGKLNGLKNNLITLDKTAEKLNARFKSFASMKYAATLRLIDRVTEPASRINSLLRKIAGGIYNISLRLNDGALSGIRKIETSLMKITSKAYTIAVNVKGAAGKKLDGLLSGAALGAGVFMPMAGVAGVGFGVANAISSSASFEKQMSKVQAIRQLDKDSAEMKALVQQAKDLGMTTAWTRQQVGEAQYYQALAGWSTENILKATPHLLNLASASDMDLGRASDIVTDSMTALGLKASDNYINSKGQKVNAAEYIMDMFAKVQAISNTDMNQLGESLKYAASTMGVFSGNAKDQAGIQQRMDVARQLLVMQGAMANAGIKGSVSGTGINTIFNRLAGGTRGAVFAEQLLGLEHAKDGEMMNPLDFIRGFQKKAREGMSLDEFYMAAELFEGQKIHADTRRQLDAIVEHGLKNGGKLGSEDIIKLSKMIAGVENAPKLSALLFQDLDELEKKLTNVEGTSAQMAETMMDNLAGSFVYLQSAWDAFQQDLFTGTAGQGLRNFVDTLTEILTNAGKLFKDGIDLSDFGAMLGDVIDRLKRKFLELDGIGSILAGGALALGLKKIISLAQSVTSILKPIGKGGSISAAQSVGTMHVTAGIVNLNGKGIPPSTSPKGTPPSKQRKIGDRSIMDWYYGTRQDYFNQQAMIANMKSAAKGAAVFSALFGALDILNTKSVNAERLAAAPPEMRAQILKENRRAEWETGGGVAGSVLGAAMGAALLSVAGPVGTAIGGVIGSILGEKLGSFLGGKGADREENQPNQQRGWGQRDTESPSQVTQKILDGFKRTTPYDDLKGIAEAQARRRQADAQEIKAIEAAREATRETLEFRKRFDADFNEHMGTNYYDTLANQNMNATLDYYRNNGIYSQNNTGFDFDILGSSHAEAAELNEEQLAQQAAMEAGTFNPDLSELPKPDTEAYFAELHAAMEEGFAQIPPIAQSNMEQVTTAFTTSKEQSQSAWAETPGFFSGIFSGLGGSAQAAGSAIFHGLTSCIGSIISEWSSAATVINGIIAGINAAGDLGASVGMKVRSVVAGVTGHAEGGFVSSPELSLIGEDGAEAVIPLSPERRARALDLYAQTGAVLGVNEVQPSSTGSNNITVNATFNLSGSLDETTAQAEEKLQELADKVAGIFSTTLADAHANQNLT